MKSTTFPRKIPRCRSPYQLFWMVLTTVGLLNCSTAWPGTVHATMRLTRQNESARVLVVERLLRNGTAAQAGLRVGDHVIAINGHPVSEMTEEDVRNHVRGEVGTRVVFRVLREGEMTPTEITVERAPR